MYLFLFFILTIMIFVALYIITRIRKIEAIREMPNKKLSWFISVLPIILLVILYYPLGLTIIVYLLHLAVFLVIGDILYRLFKKKLKYAYIFIMALVLTTGYLTYAYINANDVKKTSYVIESDKVSSEISIVFLADSHFGITVDGKEFQEYIDEISKLNPDVLIIGGDFVDEATTYDDMILACKALEKAKTKYGVYAIFGNHDLDTYGGNKNYTSLEYIAELKRNNVTLLRDETILVNNQFYLVGRQDKSIKERLGITELTKNLDKTKLIITIDHQPVDYSQEIKSSVDLVLSGHTHGGQMFPLAYINELVSSNEMTYGITKKENTSFVVTSGLSGWGIPFKTGTISEYVYLKIK